MSTATTTREILFQGPPDIDGYDRSLPLSQQNVRLPKVFHDAMEVREAVFVVEQGIPLLMEADSDDPRSCHWVVYDQLTDQSQTQPTPTPAGTLRLVPFPHPPHPIPGSSWDIDSETSSLDNLIKSQSTPYIIDRPTTFHDGREPYLKLGRWAVRNEFRGRGIAHLVVETALQWARQNPRFFNPDPGVVVGGGGGEEGLGAHGVTWKGLVCVHAQEYLVKAWAKFGFEVDEEMGRWTEAGIPHVGMFLRLKL